MSGEGRTLVVARRYQVAIDDPVGLGRQQPGIGRHVGHEVPLRIAGDRIAGDGNPRRDALRPDHRTAAVRTGAVLDCYLRGCTGRNIDTAARPGNRRGYGVGRRYRLGAGSGLQVRQARKGMEPVVAADKGVIGRQYFGDVRITAREPEQPRQVVTALS